MPIVLRFLAVFAFGAGLAAQIDPPGTVQWGRDRYVEYVAGNAPIVIAVPHGGYLKPPVVRDRTYGVTTQDGRTQETLRAIARRMEERYGLHPHLIINHLHRVKLDANREIVEAAQGDARAEQAWREFHGFIDTARRAVVRDHRRGLFLDLHGHGHPIDWIELGYLLGAAELNLPDRTLDAGSTYRDRSSIRSVVAANPGVPFSEILRGRTSLGGLLESSGLLVVPGPRFPGPGSNSYFRGGYDAARWGSRSGGAIDGVQIELPSSMRRDLAGRAAFVNGLVDALGGFCKTYYGIDLASGPRLTITAAHPVGTERGERGEFLVERTGPVAQPLSVPLAFTGRATAGRDYVALPATVTIPAGQRSVAIAVRTRQDAIAEGPETVIARLLVSPAAGYPWIGAPATASVVLLDDEQDPSSIGRWDCEDGMGEVARDRSGAGRDGRLLPVGRGPAWRRGLLSGALAFDAVDDRVVIPDFDYAARGGFTLSFWFRAPRSRGTSTQYLFSHGDVGRSNSLNVYWFESSGLLRTRVRCRTDITSSLVLDVATDFRDDAWHAYTLSVEAPFGYASVYIDGELQQRNLLAGDRLDPSGPLHLGAREDLSGSRFLRGALDEVRLFDRALARAEVVELHRAGRGAARPFGSGCRTSGKTVPLHTVTGVPGPGRSVVYEISAAAPAGAAVVFFGLSRTSFGGSELPFDLVALGAPGCDLHQDARFRVPLPLALGAGTLPIRIPADPALTGLRVHSQAMVLDARANVAGFAVSNGLETVVGG